MLEVTGPDTDRQIPLTELSTVDIGRGRDNFLCLASQSISRNHALIRRRVDGGFTIIDVGSRNGTEVNGRRIDGTVDLTDGDSIQIGEYRLIFHAPSGPVSKNSLRRGPDTGVDSTRLVVSHKPVTVLVMDLHDYTGLSRRLQPDQISWLLSKLGDRATGIFSSRQAWNFKTIADAVMGVWVHESISSVADQIRQPLSAALDMRAAVIKIGERLGVPLQMGAGMTTGEAAIGGLGAQSKVDVIGDSVNLAFRLEAATRPAGEDMLVCESTHVVLGGATAGLFRERVTPIKGYDEPVHAYGISFEALAAWLDH
jgi:adenylate cyclase